MEESKRQWWVLVTVIIGTFLGGLNQSIANLSLPKIIQDFGIPISTAAWISTAYIIANAVLVPVWGKLGDKIGRKKVYIFGLSIFMIGSLLVGLAWNFSSMLVFRIIQAIAVSADYPTAMAIIAVTFGEGKKRAQALGIWSATMALGSMLGPLIGGPVMDAFGWRSVFFLMVPLGMIGMFMVLAFVKESSASSKKFKFDFLGSITLGVAISALVLVLDKGVDWGWTSSNSLITYGVVLIFGTIFYFSEIRHEDPVVDFKFFKNAVFVSTLINNVIVSMGLMGVVFVISIFMQSYLGFTATQAGLTYVPMAVCMIIFSQLGGKLVGKVHARYVLFISMLVGSLGIFLFSVFIDVRANVWAIIVPLSIMASGLGFGMAQRTVLITSSVPQNEVGVASSVLALCRNIAGAFGIALSTVVLSNSTGRYLFDLAQNSVINVKTPRVIGEVTTLIILKAQIMGFADIFKVSAAIVFVGAIAALFIKVHKHSSTEKVPMEID